MRDPECGYLEHFCVQMLSVLFQQPARAVFSLRVQSKSVMIMRSCLHASGS